MTSPWEPVTRQNWFNDPVANADPDPGAPDKWDPEKPRRPVGGDAVYRASGPAGVPYPPKNVPTMAAPTPSAPSGQRSPEAARVPVGGHDPVYQASGATGVPFSPTTIPSMSTPDPSPATEQWVYVDPGAYSNPYTDTPVYTSGPQTVPSPPGPTALLDDAPALFDAPSHHPPSASTPPSAPEVITDPRQGRSDPLPTDNYRPEKGELKIKERRSWRTWQLVTAAVVAAILGMAINGNTGSKSGGATSSGYKLPPESGSTASTSPGTVASSAGGASTTTAAADSTSSTGPAGSTGTTAPAGSSAATATSTPAVVGPATVLVPEVQQTGNWTSPTFTIAGGTWNIGWAYQCTPAPAAPPAFQIFAVNSGSAPGATPAVSSAAATGNSITPLTSVGSQQVIVQTSAACRWAVKVTGSGT